MKRIFVSTMVFIFSVLIIFSSCSINGQDKSSEDSSFSASKQEQTTINTPEYVDRSEETDNTTVYEQTKSHSSDSDVFAPYENFIKYKGYMPNIDKEQNYVSVKAAVIKTNPYDNNPYGQLVIAAEKSDGTYDVYSYSDYDDEIKFSGLKKCAYIPTFEKADQYVVFTEYDEEMNADISTCYRIIKNKFLYGYRFIEYYTEPHSYEIITGADGKTIKLSEEEWDSFQADIVSIDFIDIK